LVQWLLGFCNLFVQFLEKNSRKNVQNKKEKEKYMVGFRQYAFALLNFKMELKYLNYSKVLMQVSPIGYGHVLLIPHVLSCLPQRIDRDSLFLALCMAKEAGNHYFRVGYNSLGGFATINHLHFQVYSVSLYFVFHI
jgi:diadenosine tetraphosphate (Ap4A) HIT family hydrolase